MEAPPRENRDEMCESGRGPSGNNPETTSRVYAFSKRVESVFTASSLDRTPGPVVDIFTPFLLDAAQLSDSLSRPMRETIAKTVVLDAGGAARDALASVIAAPNTDVVLASLQPFENGENGR
jgi:hypothetical protein